MAVFFEIQGMISFTLYNPPVFLRNEPPPLR